jgi:transcriptional regulator with PAS, ATPase and Fis domain
MLSRNMQNKVTRLFPRAKIHLPLVLSLEFKEIKAVFNNISPNGALISSLSRLPQKKMMGKIALLKYHLPNYGTLEHCGCIVRGKNNSYALRFSNLDHEGKIKLWNYITEKLLDDDQCPYCGAQYEKRPSICRICNWQLNFDSKKYILYHKKTCLIKKLNAMAEEQSIEQLEKIMQFIDVDILKNNHNSRLQELVGNSYIMRDVFSKIKKVGPMDLNVLIEGESGTGKELAARAIHELSSRKNKPFVKINIPSIPENLIESELFGYEKGSFTGAYKSKKGKFEYANGGTIFLDEIGEMPFHLQAKLLRFLQEYVIEKIGTEEINGKKVDVRILAATNCNLQSAVEKGTFRKDLFYRLNTFALYLPPVKDRGEDKVILAKYFLIKLCRGREDKKIFTDEAISVIRNYEWPGNVREIINTVRSAVTLSNKKRLTAEDLSLNYSNLLDTTGSSKKIITLEDVKQDAEKERLMEAIKETNNNITQVARNLKLSRQTVYNLKKKYSI